MSTSPATDPGAGDDGPVAPPSIADAVGGPLGIAETALPAAVFVAVYTISGSDDIKVAAIAAVALSAVLALARIVRRQTPVYALSGVIGVAISGYVAHRTGEPADFFLPGLLLNAGYAGAYLISIAVGWPLMGVIVSALTQSTDYSWRHDPVLRKAYNRASLVWAGLFLLRIAVQVPLYLADALVALGAAKVAMGVPLFIVGIWLSWLLLRNTPGGAPWARAVAKADRT